MRYTAWEEFWWNSITGARTVVDRVAMALLENKMVVLKVPSDLPWRYPMRSAIQNAFNERTDARDIVIETIDAVDNNPTDQEPGRFILQTYASSSIRTGYREKSRDQHPGLHFRQECHQKPHHLGEGTGPADRRKMAQLLPGLFPQKCGGRAVRAGGSTVFTSGDSRYIQSIDFDDCVSSYDVQQFNSFIMDESSYSTDWKRYIAAAAASVCGTDAELSAMLLEQVDFRSETAVDGLQRIDRQGDFDRRGAEDGSDHPLRYLRTGGTAELWHRIWTAQIQVLFPLIELERQKLIEKWHDSIEEALQENHVEQFGAAVTDPAEVELGTLCYMMRCRVSGDYRMLYIPEEADRERIRFLHECRNKLAQYELLRPRPGGRPAGRRLLKIKAPVGRTVSHRPADGGLRRPPGKLLRDLLIIFCLLLVDK